VVNENTECGEQSADACRLNGFYEGIGRLVPLEQFVPENPEVNCIREETDFSSDLSICPSAKPTTSISTSNPQPNPTPYNPYPNYWPRIDASVSLTVQQCFLDADNRITAPSIYAFSGLPQHGTEPLFGSYDVLGIRKDVCFDRYGRYGPYGLGYTMDQGGSGLGLHGDRNWTEAIWMNSGQIDWRRIDLGDAQKQCYARNKGRFGQAGLHNSHERIDSLADGPSEGLRHSPEAYPDFNNTYGIIPRTAVILRAWGNLDYTPALKLHIRALVNELSLNSGAEYDVHLLVEIKDIHKPIWTSQHAYEETLNATVPAEFRSMATLWSEKLMELIYPGPFQPQFAYHGPIHWVTRSMHFALQWFAVLHPEYEYFWNWEVDLKYVGHYYEFFDRISKWAKQQPRQYVWERSARFYIPSVHGNWDSFVRDTESKSSNTTRPPIWGPVDVIGINATLLDESLITAPANNPLNQQTWGHDEEADYISFNPLFDPNNTLWIYRNDVSGYNTSLPIPPRRASIVTASRLSRRLLMSMHKETYIERHSMASEMWPASICLHRGLKAVFVPHPVYFDRAWPAKYLDQIFNGGEGGTTGGYADSVFGEGPQGHEHSFQGCSYYFNSGFAGMLWRRWMGYKENGEGGGKEELGGNQWKGGRMCLRSMLLHPVKRQVGPVE
jgi:hypothetical protein